MINIIVGVETPIYFDMLFEQNCQIKLEFYRRFGKTDLPTNFRAYLGLVTDGMIISGSPF